MARYVRFGIALILVLAVSMLVVPLVPVARAEAIDPVATTGLNVRSQPNTQSEIVGFLEAGEAFTAVDVVAGEEALGNNVTWFQLPDGGYVYSAYTTASSGGGASAEISGRWIEIDRSAQIARAYEDGQVVYTAPVTVGVQAFQTPLGTYQIERRVANETMDSRTIGIPLSSPNGYFLEDVLYTQYFLNGFALHHNYWSPPAAFGNYPTSHGCIGLQLEDAEFFWDFATIGTTVVIQS